MGRHPSRAGSLVMDYYGVPRTAGMAAAPVAPGPGAATPGPGPGPAAAGLTVELDVSLRALADELGRERDWRERIAAGITAIEVPAIGAFTSPQTPYLQGTWGPNDGFAWAVQRLTVATLSAADTMLIYRGASVADATGSQNLLQGFAGSAGPVQAWTPGRSGCILAAQQNLIITGTLTGGPYMLNADVIQIESWLLPYFLL